MELTKYAISINIIYNKSISKRNKGQCRDNLRKILKEKKDVI